MYSFCFNSLLDIPINRNTSYKDLLFLIFRRTIQIERINKFTFVKSFFNLDINPRYKEDFNSTDPSYEDSTVYVQHARDSRLILSRSRWWFYEEVDIRPWPMLCVSLVSEWMHVRREWTAPSVITLHVNSRSSSFRSTRRTSPGTWHVCAVISPTIEEQAKHIRSSSFVGLRIRIRFENRRVLDAFFIFQPSNFEEI